MQFLLKIGCCEQALIKGLFLLAVSAQLIVAFQRVMALSSPKATAGSEEGVAAC